jgi:prevent-host-death family protein
MPTVRASDAKNRFGEMVDIAQREPVRIERHGRAVAVLVSEAEYAALEQMKLERLREKLARGAADISAGRTFNLETAFSFLDRADAK